jgi:hypothetical protein
MSFRMKRGAAIGFTPMVVAALAMGCSNDSPVAPTSLNNDAALQSSASAATSGAPAEGIVVEGVSVPGVALGDTRAQVEDAYGDPLWTVVPERRGSWRSRLLCFPGDWWWTGRRAVSGPRWRPCQQLAR